jgi:hypothetical protein
MPLLSRQTRLTSRQTAGTVANCQPAGWHVVNSTEDTAMIFEYGLVTEETKQPPQIVNMDSPGVKNFR